MTYVLVLTADPVSLVFRVYVHCIYKMYLEIFISHSVVAWIHTLTAGKKKLREKLACLLLSLRVLFIIILKGSVVSVGHLKSSKLGSLHY